MSGRRDGLVAQWKLLLGARDWRGRARTPRSAEPWALPAGARDGDAFPTGWARTSAARAIRHGIQRGLLRPVTWQTTRPQVYGLDHLDGLSEPVVFVSNHASHLDAPLILGSLPPRYAKRVAVGAAADYFFDARWRAALTALVFNAFPIERHGARRGGSLAPALLARGWSLLLFPEGTRSQDGWMSSLKHGAAHLCVTRKAPAVPIALRGTFGAMPRGRNWPVPGRRAVTVRYGPPLRPAEGESTRAFHQRVAEAVARLWSEQDLGWYASLRAAEQGTLPATTGPQGASWRRIWESTRPLAADRPPPAWRSSTPR